jgi:hypothetical protein
MRQLIGIITILLVAQTVAGQGKGNGKGKRGGGGSAEGGGTAISVSVVFGDSGQREIQQWVQATPAGRLPPGLAKRGELPPGLQKQLRRNGTLPPGLQKKISAFPPELNARLGPLPPDCGCDRIFLDGKALIIARATMAILDVISLF